MAVIACQPPGSRPRTHIVAGLQEWTLVPVGALQWLQGESDDFEKPETAQDDFWWRAEFARRCSVSELSREALARELCPGDPDECVMPGATGGMPCQQRAWERYLWSAERILALFGPPSSGRAGTSQDASTVTDIR